MKKLLVCFARIPRFDEIPAGLLYRPDHPASSAAVADEYLRTIAGYLTGGKVEIVILRFDADSDSPHAAALLEHLSAAYGFSFSDARPALSEIELCHRDALLFLGEDADGIFPAAGTCWNLRTLRIYDPEQFLEASQITAAIEAGTAIGDALNEIS